MPVLPEKRFIVACARLKRLVFAIPQECGLSPAEICKLQSLDGVRQRDCDVLRDTISRLVWSIRLARSGNPFMARCPVEPYIRLLMSGLWIVAIAVL